VRTWGRETRLGPTPTQIEAQIIGVGLRQRNSKRIHFPPLHTAHHTLHHFHTFGIFLR
jgi:hypothetical protein